MQMREVRLNFAIFIIFLILFSELYLFIAPNMNVLLEGQINSIQYSVAKLYVLKQCTFSYRNTPWYL